MFLVLETVAVKRLVSKANYSVEILRFFCHFCKSDPDLLNPMNTMRISVQAVKYCHWPKALDQEPIFNLYFLQNWETQARQGLWMVVVEAKTISSRMSLFSVQDLKMMITKVHHIVLVSKWFDEPTKSRTSLNGIQIFDILARTSGGRRLDKWTVWKLSRLTLTYFNFFVKSKIYLSFFQIYLTK